MDSEASLLCAILVLSRLAVQLTFELSFCSHDRNPNTPFPKVMVATVNDAPSFICSPSTANAGTKTIPPPTGTALASDAEGRQRGVGQGAGGVR